MPREAARRPPPPPPTKTAPGAAEEPEGRRVHIPDPVSPRELASRLQIKPFHVLANAMEEGEFHSLNSKMTFQVATKIARRHGFEAIRENE